MNERELKALLDRLDEKTEKLAELDTTLKHRDQHMAKVQSLLLGFGDPQASSLTEFIQRMVFEHKRLKITERDHADLISALDEVPLSKEDHESYPAYALRVGDRMRALKDETIALQQDLHEARLEHGNDHSIISGLQQHVSNRDARIYQLEKRESELNALHDTIEALQGFSMQPEEKYAEYLQRLAADRAHHADERARLFTELEHLKASTAQTLERLRSQLDQNNLQYAAERAKNQMLTEKHNDLHAANDELRRQRDAWMDGRYLVHFEPGLHGLHWAVVDKGVVTDFSPVAAGANMHGISAPRPEIGLWCTRVVHQPQPGQREMVEVEMPIIIRAIENADAAKSAVDMQAECSKISAEREHFRTKWDESLKARDSAHDEARRTRETNESLQGQLTLHSQIIARVMMDPATDKLFNEREWSDAARKVLIDARALCGEDGKVQA